MATSTNEFKQTTITEIKQNNHGLSKVTNVIKLFGYNLSFNLVERNLSKIS